MLDMNNFHSSNLALKEREYSVGPTLLKFSLRLLLISFPVSFAKSTEFSGNSIVSNATLVRTWGNKKTPTNKNQRTHSRKSVIRNS